MFSFDTKREPEKCQRFRRAGATKKGLLISADSNKADLSILLDACEDYMLNRKTAEKIVSEVIDAVKNWREMAIRLGLSKREMDMFAGVLDEWCKWE